MQTHTSPNTPARIGGAQPKPEPKHTHPRRTTQPGVAGYKRSAHRSTHTPRHASQEWRGAAKTPVQAHTHTPHTPVKNGGVQQERTRKRKHTPGPERRVAGRSRNLSPRTHSRTVNSSQEWRGTTGARTGAHTQANRPARSGGAQPKPEPKDTRRHRVPQPGVVGHQRSAHRNTHIPQHPRREWRGAAETRAQAHTPTPHTPARSGGA